MNILQVNTYDISAGAERIASDLHSSYRARGHVCYSAVRERKGTDSGFVVIPNDVLRNRWTRGCLSLEKLFVRARLRGLPLGCRILASIGEPGRWLKRRRGFEDFEFPGTCHLLGLSQRSPDILHLHNLHGGYVDLRELPRLTKYTPSVMTLHDEWMYTGHCSGTLGCSRWQRGCGQCPDLNIPPAVPRDATSYNWGRKRDIYEQSELYLATPSRWLMNRALSSILRVAVRDWRVIPNGIDLSVFHPGPKAAARQELGLLPNAWISLFVGFNLHSKFKDYKTIESSVTQVSAQDGRPHYLICVGEPGKELRRGSLVVRFVDYEPDRNKLARYYQAADVYLQASHADNFPTTILEAMGCGTPVVATRVGGIPEQVEDGATGFLVQVHDPVAMAERILVLQRNEPLRKAMGVNGSQRARNLFSLEHMVDNYLDWYREILRNPESRRRNHAV